MLLITGATGFVGTNLLRNLHHYKKGIRCLVRNENKLYRNTEVEVVQGDISDKNILNKATNGVDVVVHLAAVIKSSAPEEFINVNLTGTKNLVEACLRNKVKKIIYVSSLDVTLNKINIYAKTKASGEDEVVKSDIDYIILRPSMIYGKDSEDMCILARMVRAFPIIPVIGSGEYKLQPVFIDDVCGIITKLVDSEIKNKVYFIAGEQKINMNALIDKIAALYTKKTLKIHIPLWSLWLPIKLYNLFLKNSPISYDSLKMINQDKICEISEIKKDFNFRPVNIDDGLRLALNGIK